uniref:Uncharacterized protein n=1 Tax=Globodera rostochiensis TaxID=31243 RepID=A0A914HIN9_GLORO
MFLQSDQFFVARCFALLNEIIAVHPTNNSERRPTKHHIHQPNCLKQLNVALMNFSPNLSSGHSFILEDSEQCRHIGGALVIDDDEDAIFLGKSPNIFAIFID